MTFYQKYVSLCTNRKISPSAAAQKMGISKTTVHRWKNGGGVTDANLQIIANYFGITVEELLKDDTENEKKPTAQGDGLITSLPQDVQEIISLCQESPQLASALLNLAQQLQNRSSGQA